MNSVNLAKFAAIVVVGAVLAGCSTAPKPPVIIDQTTTVVVSPPDSLYNCPEFSKLPNPETLTIQQAINVIDQLIRINQTCATNMRQIKSYVERAKITNAN